MKLLITDIFGCCDKVKVRNDVIFKQWLCRIIIPRFMNVGSQIPELDLGGGLFCPPYKLSSQNTPI